MSQRVRAVGYHAILSLITYIITIEATWKTFQSSYITKHNRISNHCGKIELCEFY